MVWVLGFSKRWHWLPICVVASDLHFELTLCVRSIFPGRQLRKQGAHVFDFIELKWKAAKEGEEEEQEEEEEENE